MDFSKVPAVRRRLPASAQFMEFLGLTVSRGHRGWECEHSDRSQGNPYLESGEVRWANRKMVSMPLLWLWFQKYQRRQASGPVRALGEGDIAL